MEPSVWVSLVGVLITVGAIVFTNGRQMGKSEENHRILTSVAEEVKGQSTELALIKRDLARGTERFEVLEARQGYHRALIGEVRHELADKVMTGLKYSGIKNRDGDEVFRDLMYVKNIGIPAEER